MPPGHSAFFVACDTQTLPTLARSGRINRTLLEELHLTHPFAGSPQLPYIHLCYVVPVRRASGCLRCNFLAAGDLLLVSNPTQTWGASAIPSRCRCPAFLHQPQGGWLCRAIKPLLPRDSASFGSRFSLYWLAFQAQSSSFNSLFTVRMSLMMPYNRSTSITPMMIACITIMILSFLLSISRIIRFI